MSLEIKCYSVYIETKKKINQRNFESREEAMGFLNNMFKVYGVDNIVAYKVTVSFERLLLAYER